MYDELVKQCRDCIDCLCGECKYRHLQTAGNFVPCMNALLGEAADAIEAMNKYVNTEKRSETPMNTTASKKRGNMTEVKIVMDDYGLLYVILPDGSKRAIRADIFGNPYYGIVQVGEEPKEE